MWDQDSSSSSTSIDSSSNSGGASTGNRGPEASCSSRYSSSIQSFDDWDAPEGDFAFPVPASMPRNEALFLTGSATSSSSAASSNPAAAAAAAAAASIHSLTSGTGLEGLWAAAVQQPSRDLASSADLMGNRGLWQDMGDVYVLLFGVGQKDTEGIYSLRAVSEDGLPTETIIAFENMDDAVR
jgi:hypothetical protein